MKVIKRDKKSVNFNAKKIRSAIRKAGNVSDKDLETIINHITEEAEKRQEITVEEIQDLVEDQLMRTGNNETARSYVRYRYKRELLRQDNTADSIIQLINNKNEYLADENSNKNTRIASTQRDYIAGEVSKDISKRLLLDDDIIEAHNKGVIHFHDMDYYIQPIFNCCLVNVGDMLQNGTVINKTMIEKPHSFSTACNVATQISAIVASNQYGGQTMSLSHLAPFVDVSRQRIIQELKDDFSELDPDSEIFKDVVERRVKAEIKKGIKIIQYQLNTLFTTNGQTPFITIFMYLGEVMDKQTKADLALVIEEVLEQRLKGVKNEIGMWISPAFPKLIYVLEEDNITEGSPYWYLTKLAAKCTAKRMVPDYISEKRVLELKHPTLLPFAERRDTWGDEHIWGTNPLKSLTDEDCAKLDELVTARWNAGDRQPSHYIDIAKSVGMTVESLVPKAYPCMGCRSFLTPDPIHYKYYGRFNQGVVTTNIPYIACQARKKYPDDEEKRVQYFFTIFAKNLELCHRALQLRHRRLLNTSTNVSPLHWQYGALSRLTKDETISPLLFDNYSTISLGYAGLYEAVMALIGKSHTTDEGHKLAVEILQTLNNKCKEWRANENISYSVYGTPIESTTYKFAQALQKAFGSIPEVSDHNYITNSYHINVREPIDPFTKLKIEDEYQALSPGGCISYIETADLTQNIQAVLSVMQFIYKDNIYAELNSKSDCCHVCGYTGEIKIVEENGKLIWECPQCHNRDQRKMSVSRRTCGYIGSNFWNQGRTQEIRDRYVHLGANQELDLCS